MGYKTPAAVEVALNQLVSQFPDLCSPIDLGQTAEGRALQALQIGSGGRNVVVTGGIHAREWAPPDALLSFTRRLLNANHTGTDIAYPTVVINGVTYCNPPYVVRAAEVRAIFERFTVFVFPLVNPDGRQFSMRGSSGVPTAREQMWRKNRRTFTAGVGVDVNRNFDIAWDHETYYNPDAAAKVRVSVDPSQDLFKGPQAFSEAESRAVRDLVQPNRPIAFVDVHSHGRQILYSWGMDRSQPDDDTQNFANPVFDHLPGLASSGRDGLLTDDYMEFNPQNNVDTLTRVATVMANEIEASAGMAPFAQQQSLYVPTPSVNAGALPASTFVGAADDWVYSQQFVDSSFGEVFAFTVEAGKELERPGDDDDGGFFPDFATQYQKVEREIHAALYGLLIRGGL
jgi:murein tripeptide amidase MpaA